MPFQEMRFVLYVCDGFVNHIVIQYTTATQLLCIWLAFSLQQLAMKKEKNVKQNTIIMVIEMHNFTVVTSNCLNLLV